METGRLVSISFDDIDSRFWGCTTHLAGLFLIEASRTPGVYPLDYPLLVRLNPAIPWKTRGNAAVVLRFHVDGDDRARDLCELAVSMALDYAGPRLGEPVKQPGIACALGEPWRDPTARALYRRALTDVVTTDQALALVSRIPGARAYGGRGRIGAVSALAALGPGEPFTFELAAYRRPELWGSPRCVRHELAPRVEAHMPPCVFNNYDPYTSKVTAAPGGPDPVLAGFRGTCPEYLPGYYHLLCEEPHFWILYRSNQHTDPHALPLGQPRPYKTGSTTAIVDEDPVITGGGHVIVKALLSDSGVDVDLAFYRETGPLNEAARLLRRGDVVSVLVNVRPYKPRGRLVLTVEKMQVLHVASHVETHAPRCPKCGHRMKRLGSSGGYRCPSCGYKDPKASTVTIRIPRILSPGTYTPGEGRLRHLTAPWPPPQLYITRPPTWELILSASADPPVIDPSLSTGAH